MEYEFGGDNMVDDLLGLDYDEEIDKTTAIKPEDQAFKDGFEMGKKKKLTELVTFQAFEQMRLLYTQLIFYETFVEETESLLTAHKFGPHL